MKIKDKYWVNNENFDGPYDPELEDFYYDLVDGGYINPEYCLNNQSDIDKVNLAIKVLEAYKKALQDVVDDYDYIEDCEDVFNDNAERIH